MLGDPYLAQYVFANYTTISSSAWILLQGDNLTYIFYFSSLETQTEGTKHFEAVKYV